MDEEFTEIFDILQNLKETMSTLNKKIKTLEKQTQKQQKQFIKIQQKQKREKKNLLGLQHQLLYLNRFVISWINHMGHKLLERT